MWRHNGSKLQKFYLNIINLILLFVVAATCVLISSVQTTILLDDTCPQLTVQRVHQQAQKHEIALIFYYVSWSNDGQTALGVYKQLVEQYTKHIYFAKIDCFNSACNCSNIYQDLNGKSMSPYRWPTLIAHYGNQRMVRYSGEWNYECMVQFLEGLLQPIQRVSNHGELKQLLMNYDTVILALLPNFNENLAHYVEYVHVAYHFMEFDTNHAYIFAMALGGYITNDVANVSESPKLFMYTDNHQSELHQRYNYVEEFNGKMWQRNRIIIWLQNSFKRQFSELYAYNSPKTLAMQVRKQPVLSILVPTNRINYFNIINQNYTKTPATISTTIQISETCLVFKNFNKNNDNSCQKLPLKMTALFYNNYQHKQLCNYLNGRSEIESQRDFDTFNIWMDKLNRSKLHAPNVRIVIAKYIKKSIDFIKMKYKLQHYNTIFSNNYNNSLTVMLIDIDKHYNMLAQHDIKLTDNMTAIAFIANSEHESIYLMSQNYNFNALLEFVHNYYENNLIKHQQISSTILLQDLQEEKLKSQQNIKYIDYVSDINGTMLMNLLKSQSNNNITIVLLMYASNCALCAVILQPLLQLSAMLHNDIDNDKNDDDNKYQQIKFFRINTQFNNLPWELNVPRTPTLLVYPHQLNGDSRKFPNILETDWRNIFAFILAQLEPIEQMHLVLRVCQRTIMPSDNLQNCLQFAQKLVVKHISHHLRYWQMHNHERPQLLDRLNEYKNFYMTIQKKLRIQQ